MNVLKNQLEAIGLTESDVDEGITSIDDLVNHVASSMILFRKTLRCLVFRQIRTYFDSEALSLSDDLRKYFPRRGRMREWTKFREFLDLRVPRLRLTALATTLLVVVCVVFLGFYLWIVFAQTELLIHSLVSKVPLLSIIFPLTVLPVGFIALVGRTRLPARTFDELVDEIISSNFADLLGDDKRMFKEIIRQELER
jgi:hypothetical protein